MTISDARPRRRDHTSGPAQRMTAAGLDCLADGGMAALTIDSICTRAGVEIQDFVRDFGDKDHLIAAIYESAYQPMLSILAPGSGALGLGPLIERIFDAEERDHRTFRIWLALWAEMGVNPVLMRAHRRNYWHYRAVVRGAIAAHCLGRGLQLDAEALASGVIGLIDGLWLEQCIDPEGFDRNRALDACLGMLEPLLGPLDA
ncbi:MAG: TetR family transcriptional regulator C-terminal domain-containing protein [Tabrizicola sp.]|nr:TetR family transcriptional regulator C-terminal domain-containing protein [Tabrizicola sp.]